MTAQTPPPRWLTSADHQAVAAAFGFRSVTHMAEVCTGKAPSALAESSIWRDRARRAER